MGDEGTDLLIAAQRAAQESPYRDLQLVADQAAGRPGGINMVGGKYLTIVGGPLQQVCLLVVVGYQHDVISRIGRCRGIPWLS